MVDMVDSYLARCKINETTEKQVYCYYVMEHANLMTDERDLVAVSEEEYYSHLFHLPKYSLYEKGKYYLRKTLPVEVTEEEFNAIEKTISEKDKAEIRMKATGEYFRERSMGKSTAARFFTVIAVMLWVFGYFISKDSAYVSITKGSYYTYTTRQFDNSLFWSNYAIYVVSGCFSLCAAELFRKLQTIVNLLRRIS